IATPTIIHNATQIVADVVRKNYSAFCAFCYGCFDNLLFLHRKHSICIIQKSILEISKILK
ncbi:MAG TPA: hypothetical protein PLM75_05220, partial [bacterium]|nr:hypothetical protein [bacterium]